MRLFREDPALTAAIHAQQPPVQQGQQHHQSGGAQSRHKTDIRPMQRRYLSSNSAKDPKIFEEGRRDTQQHELHCKRHQAQHQRGTEEEILRPPADHIKIPRANLRERKCHFRQTEDDRKSLAEEEDQRYSEADQYELQGLGSFLSFLCEAGRRARVFKHQLKQEQEHHLRNIEVLDTDEMICLIHIYLIPNPHYPILDNVVP